MTARLFVLVMLFSLASVISGVILALTTWMAPRIGVAAGPCAFPLAIFIGFVGVFFLGRRDVLPPELAVPAWKATAVLTLWLGLTFALWQATMAVVRPVMRSVGFERGTFAILLVCLLASLFMIERLLRSGVPR